MFPEVTFKKRENEAYKDDIAESSLLQVFLYGCTQRK